MVQPHFLPALSLFHLAFLLFVVIVKVGRILPDALNEKICLRNAKSEGVGCLLDTSFILAFLQTLEGFRTGPLAELVIVVSDRDFRHHYGCCPQRGVDA